MTAIVRIMDPEIVFVANLTNANAPALVASFQCDFSLSTGPLTQRMTAQMHDLKVLACPFIRKKGEKNITTVSQFTIYNITTIYKASYTWSNIFRSRLAKVFFYVGARDGIRIVSLYGM